MPLYQENPESFRQVSDNDGVLNIEMLSSAEEICRCARKSLDSAAHPEKRRELQYNTKV